MKFGLEGEKLLYDLKDDTIFHGVFRLVDALADYTRHHGDAFRDRVTNEFVVHMVETNAIASVRQRAVIDDYVFLHGVVSDVAAREDVVPLPLGAIPFHFTPTMAPRWSYYVQNSILSGRRLASWVLAPDAPLADAGNCAGVHAHFEIGTPPEFLALTQELVHKHNAGLMLTPLVAFSASPYFYGQHEAWSMRAHRYFGRVYERFPLNGGLPPVMRTSEEVLRYTRGAIEAWIDAGIAIGFSHEDMIGVTRQKGANWSMLRWNRTWNTVELRCLESDRLDLDVAKFTWAAGAMRRVDEGLVPVPLDTRRSIDWAMIEETLDVAGGEVSILPTHAIHELTGRAVSRGLDDPCVARYLERLAAFSRPGVDADCLDEHSRLVQVLATRQTTADVVLAATGGRRTIDHDACVPVVRELVQRERYALAQRRRTLVASTHSAPPPPLQPA